MLDGLKALCALTGQQNSVLLVFLFEPHTRHVGSLYLSDVNMFAVFVCYVTQHMLNTRQMSENILIPKSNQSNCSEAVRSHGYHAVCEGTSAEHLADDAAQNAAQTGSSDSAAADSHANGSSSLIWDQTSLQHRCRLNYSTSTCVCVCVCWGVGSWDAWWSTRKAKHHAGKELCRENRQTFIFSLQNTKENLVFFTELNTAALLTHQNQTVHSLKFNPHMKWEDPPVQFKLAYQVRAQGGRGFKMNKNTHFLLSLWTKNEVSFHSLILPNKKYTFKVN